MATEENSTPQLPQEHHDSIGDHSESGSADTPRETPLLTLTEGIDGMREIIIGDETAQYTIPGVGRVSRDEIGRALNWHELGVMRSHLDSHHLKDRQLRHAESLLVRDSILLRREMDGNKSQAA